MTSLLLTSSIAVIQVLVGIATISLLQPSTLRTLPRLFRAGSALLLGVAVSGFLTLLPAMAGATIHLWWWGTLAVGALFVTVIRRTAIRNLFTPDAGRVCFPGGPLAFLGLGVLLAWVTLDCFALPVHEYDGLVIWSYRLRVLAHEHTLFADSLRDPERVIPQPVHPYLLPMCQLPYAMIRPDAWLRLAQIPMVMVYAGYLLMVVGAAKSLGSTRGALLICCAGLLPCLGFGITEISSREPFMGFLGFASVVLLAFWAENPRPGYLILGAAAAFLMQQTKIEGLPFAGGWCMGVLLVSVGDNPRVRFRQLVACAVFVLLTLPWAMMKSHIHAGHVDPVLRDYSVATKFRVSDVLTIVRLLAVEVTCRPELYGLAAFGMFAGVLTGWKRRNALRRLAVFAAPLACLCAICAIYAVRQTELPQERNASLTRRLLCVLPAMAFAAAYAPATRRLEIQETLNRAEGDLPADISN